MASVQESGKLPSGAEVTIVRGEYRARLGSGQADVGGALWVQAEPISEPEPTEQEQALASEYRAILENLVESQGSTAVSCSSSARRVPPASLPTWRASRRT